MRSHRDPIELGLVTDGRNGPTKSRQHDGTEAQRSLEPVKELRVQTIQQSFQVIPERRQNMEKACHRCEDEQSCSRLVKAVLELVGLGCVACVVLDLGIDGL